MMNEKTFQAAIRYGSVALAISVVLNIWVVMRNVEVFRDATNSERQVQQLAAQQQVLQGVLQEFMARTGTDPKLGEFFKRIQVPAAQPNQSQGITQ